MDYRETERNIQRMVDDLQGLCSSFGLSNTANEEVIVTSTFLYKYLNDKFLHNIRNYAKKHKKSAADIFETGVPEDFYSVYAKDVVFEIEDTIEYLAKYADQSEFYLKFDETLTHIVQNERNRSFAAASADGEKIELFAPLSNMVAAPHRDKFLRSVINILMRYDFSDAFDGGFDFFVSIFDYLIKKYNASSGVYAEYYTPQVASALIAKLLVGNKKEKAPIEIYDPAAGSGSLILHLAHELERKNGAGSTVIYTQDIAQKSTRFLRLNMILNGKSESIGNVICGDTLLIPAHFEAKNDSKNGLKHFDYIVVNPPFKTDFSVSRDAIAEKWQDTDRYFAGIPNIPKTSKDTMAIYLLFVQHILYSLKDDGKAAVVVPTSFLTASNSIEVSIRRKLIEEKILQGVVSMPANLFADTQMAVSILIIDKAYSGNTVLLMDASDLGIKARDGRIQRTVLSADETRKIVDTFQSGEQTEDFSVSVAFKQIQDKNYSLSAKQYFASKIKRVDTTGDDFTLQIKKYKDSLTEKLEKGRELEERIIQQLGDLSYDG